MKLSIIIPALNEEDTICRTLTLISHSPHEIIVVDGGSGDRTKELAHRYTPHVLSSSPGRGIQQVRGANYAGGDIFLFLHADTLLPKGFEEMIEETLAEPRVIFGAFLLKINPSSAALNLIALAANLRSRYLKMPYGDQGLFMRRKHYFGAGGFKDLPIMEDVDLVQRLKKKGGFMLTRGCVRTSARRWRKEGVLSATRRNWTLMLRYLLGESPHRLKHLYTDRR